MTQKEIRQLLGSLEARINGTDDPFMKIAGISIDLGVGGYRSERLIIKLEDAEFRQVKSPVMTTEQEASVTPQGFEEFWKLYDKRVGRAKCEKLWARLSKREQADCMSYIPLYKQAQTAKQYRKNPETFLRNKSWNDELIFNDNADNRDTIEQQRMRKLASIIAG